MEKISKCCGVKRKLIDNWASNHDEEDIRFSYVCSSCEKEFTEKQYGNK